jgi:hypothetical protein
MDRSHKKCRRLNEGNSLAEKENSFIHLPPVILGSGIFYSYHKKQDKKREDLRRQPGAKGPSVPWPRSGKMGGILRM